ncbi:unnamed protein product [Mytilus coruscus]|uniref:AIG1-type G domain-containing protein n=1 Tax=Mytilus coruscus TaxID=42192 RepID=A0A6J8BN65_MYTCO|nr:unnamed protein product [Mytilus coruscus]
MWRRCTLKVATWKKAVSQKITTPIQEKPAQIAGDVATETAKHLEEEASTTHLLIREGIKLFLAMNMIGITVKKEKHRNSRQEQVILFGKQGSEMKFVGNSLLGSGCNVSVKNASQPKSYINENTEDNKSRGTQNIEKKSCGNKSPVVIDVMEGFNEQFNRKINITYLYLDTSATTNQNALSSLLISEEYSVVFCFPVSYRFTTEDLHLWNTYLKYRQREDFERVTVVFTYCDRLEVSVEDYIENLPTEFRDFLKRCGDKHMFFNICPKKAKENQRHIKRLIQPMPGIKYSQKLRRLFAFFVGPHIYFFLMI